MDHCDMELSELVAKGKTQGYLTYDEVNDYLPDEAVDPEKLDSLLVALDEMGIELVTEAPVAEADANGSGRRRPRPAEELEAEEIGAAAQHAAAGSDGRFAEAERRSDSDVSVANGGNSAAHPRRRNFAGQEDRSDAEAIPPLGAGLQLRHAGHGRHAGKSPSTAFCRSTGRSRSR